MNRQVFPELLGAVSTELLLQNLTNTNLVSEANADRVRLAFPRGFTVTGEFEMFVYENETEQQEEIDAANRRMAEAKNLDQQIKALISPDKVLVRLVLEPKT